MPASSWSRSSPPTTPAGRSPTSPKPSPPPAPPTDAAAVATAERVRGLLAGLARQAAATGAEEVALDDGFFAAAGALPEEPDWAAGVLFQVAAPEAAALDAAAPDIAAAPD